MDKQLVLLSVCITTFNMENYIERAIESVLMQKTNFDYEIIIADDCSTDNTLKILEKYSEQNQDLFTIIVAKENKGIIENCTIALKAAKGKYIAILDADDYWITKDKLQKQLDILENEQEMDFVYTNFRYIDEQGNLSGVGIGEDFVVPKKFEFQKYLLYPYISPSTICFKQSLLDFNRFDIFIQKRFASQEYALFLDFTKNGLGKYLNECTMYYTVRNDSLSRQIDINKKIQNFKSNYETGSWFVKENPISNKLESIRTFNFRFKVMLASWSSHKFDYVKKYSKDLKLSDFLKHNPKAAYIYIASKNKWLYKLIKPWVLRKRPPGQ